MRTWRGVVAKEHAQTYLDHQDQTGVKEYRETPGNLGVYVLRRDLGGDRVEVTTVSLWESMDSVKGFAGEDPDVAVFYPGDDDLLVEKDLKVDHFEVVSADVADLPGG